jgi:carbamoyl-phosphate synthase large subunit
MKAQERHDSQSKVWMGGKDTMNFLVTAVGSFSGEAVITSLKKNGNAKVIACDIHPFHWLPVAPFADAFYQLPIAYDKESYINELIRIIKKEKIDFIIPLTDPEVDLFSEVQGLIENQNTIICIPDKHAVTICRNKQVFYRFFQEDEGVGLIPTFESLHFNPDMCRLPLIAKPKHGRSSVGVFVIHSEDELQLFSKKKDFIFQPILEGQIFTVDCIRDKKFDKSVALPRKELIRTSNGAGMSIEIVPNVGLSRTAQHIVEKLDINGCINMEFIHHQGRFFLMDINPRFSAGISFSILAGYDMVTNHVRCFMGEEIEDLVSPKTMILAKKLTDVIIKKESF